MKKNKVTTIILIVACSLGLFSQSLYANTLVTVTQCFDIIIKKELDNNGALVNYQAFIETTPNIQYSMRVIYLPQPLATLSSIVAGSTIPNVIIGTSGDDLIYAGDGNDRICAGSGNDFVYGKRGNDQINGNSGNDTLFGGKDQDIVRGGKDNDTVYGDLGKDTVYGDLGSDFVDGGTDQGYIADTCYTDSSDTVINCEITP